MVPVCPPHLVNIYIDYAALSPTFRLPVSILSLYSYRGDGGHKRGQFCKLLTIHHQISATLQPLPGHRRPHLATFTSPALTFTSTTQPAPTSGNFLWRTNEDTQHEKALYLTRRQINIIDTKIVSVAPSEDRHMIYNYVWPNLPHHLPSSWSWVAKPLNLRMPETRLGRLLAASLRISSMTKDGTTHPWTTRSSNRVRTSSSCWILIAHLKKSSVVLEVRTPSQQVQPPEVDRS